MQIGCTSTLVGLVSARYECCAAVHRHAYIVQKWQPVHGLRDAVGDTRAYGAKIKNGVRGEGEGDTIVCSGETTLMHSRLGRSMTVGGVLGFSMRPEQYPYQHIATTLEQPTVTAITPLSLKLNDFCLSFSCFN
ncbi:hypothetical protein 24 [Diadegma semiclausum ichnovirus]|nr:hypothetical protein 24 [Diadegma semiclausum ichnovirus]